MINIYSKELTREQRQVVNKGLNYVPTNTGDKFEFTKDVHRFCCKIRVKNHFYYMNKKDRTLLSKLKSKSTFDPVVNSKTLEAFKEIVTLEKWDKCHHQRKLRHIVI